MEAIKPALILGFEVFQGGRNSDFLEIVGYMVAYL